MSTHGFAYLTLGLLEYINGEQFPKKLQFGLAALANQQPHKAPKTLQGALQRCTEPIETWWSVDSLPSAVDPNEPLLIFDGKDVLFPHSIQAYLNGLTTDSRYSKSITTVNAVSDQYRFQQFKNDLRDKYTADPQQAQKTYQAVRHFLIKDWDLNYCPTRELGNSPIVPLR